MNHNKALTWLASIILVVSIAICVFTLIYVVTSKDNLSREFNELKQQLQEYNFPKDEVKDVTIDEAKLYLAVAKYCEDNDDCQGEPGRNGLTPECLFEPSKCQGHDGYTPVKNKDYFDGITPPCYFTASQCQGYTPQKEVDYFDGQDGRDGREIEQRCNPETNQVEWRYMGDENWQVLYNLSNGQSCAEEGE